jgi:putative FmdB family regulatory protein
MPTYDYQCKTCETVFSISGPYSTLIGCKPHCPCCRSTGNSIKKLIRNINVIYGTKGFYNTDNKKEEKNGN